MNTRYRDFWPYRVQLVDRFGFRHKAILLGVVGIIYRNAIGCGMNLFIKQSHIIQSAIIDFKYFHGVFTSWKHSNSSARRLFLRALRI